MTAGNFNGLCVLALESRRSREIATLIANLGGVPIVAPSVREVPLDSNYAALEFVRRLAAHQVDIVIFTTGVGVRVLASAVEKICPQDELSRLLNEAAIIARGPKPTAALRGLGIRVSVTVPEPNTWRELLKLLDQNKNSFPVVGRRVAIQEYGVRNSELVSGLEERGAIVTSVDVYQWALPEDLTPLQNAIDSIIRGDAHVLLVASSVQIRHLFQVAETTGQAKTLGEALSRVVVASIGPLTSEELRSRSLNVDIESTHPKMGFLVQEAAEKAPDLLQRKRGQHSSTTEDHP